MEEKGNFLKRVCEVGNHVLIVLLNVIPFSVSLLFTDFSGRTELERWLIIGILCAAYFGVVCLVQRREYRTKKKMQIRSEINQARATAKTVLSHLTQLADDKTHKIKEQTYIDKKTNFPKGLGHSEVLFYNVHQYLMDICLNLRDVVAELIEADNEYVDVSLIYRYEGENEPWKWAIGRSGTSDACRLEELVNEKGSFFHYLITGESGKGIQKSSMGEDAHDHDIVFANEKKALIDRECYAPGRRDKLFKGVGSIMGINLTAFNNEASLVHAVMIVSTYGVNFVNVDTHDKSDVEAFERRISCEVLPYYISHIQSELCSMYLRHQKRAVQEIMAMQMGLNQI